MANFGSILNLWLPHYYCRMLSVLSWSADLSSGSISQGGSGIYLHPLCRTTEGRKSVFAAAMISWAGAMGFFYFSLGGSVNLQLVVVILFATSPPPLGFLEGKDGFLCSSAGIQSSRKKYHMSLRKHGKSQNLLPSGPNSPSNKGHELIGSHVNFNLHSMYSIQFIEIILMWSAKYP